MFVIKNGMVHKCNTVERYNAFIAAGWEAYEPCKEEKATEKKKAIKSK